MFQSYLEGGTNNHERHREGGTWMGERMEGNKKEYFLLRRSKKSWTK